MIPSQELRIGNYVLVGQTMQRISMIDNTASSTTRISFDSNGKETETNTQHLLENLQPVPLSNAILQQCKFVYHDYFKFWQLVAGHGEKRSEMDIDPDYNVIDFMRKPVVKRVTSFHQLQNVYFMLKGKELAYQQKA